MKFTNLLFLFIIAVSLCTSCHQQPANDTDTTMQEKTMSQEAAMKLIKPFYDFLGGDSTPEQVKPSYHDDWRSYYSNTGSRSMEETIGFVSGPLAQMVPDLKWEIKEVYITSGNQIIVRGEATGTPVGESFMGSSLAGGKRFELMSIDIHELRDGKIARTYHVEDWLNAIQQVAKSE